MSSPDKFLREMTEAHPDLPGTASDAMRARLAAHAAFDLIQDVMLADARTRESVLRGVCMALRCGALLLKEGHDWTRLLRATGISEQAAAGYVAMALTHPELAAIASRRFGRITEAQAQDILGRSAVTGPVDDLRALRGLLA